MQQKWNGFLFAGCSIPPANDYIIEKKCNRLYSQFNERKAIENFWADERTHDVTFVIDSGAFSAANSGQVINFEEYINWINQNTHHPNSYFVELDVTPLNDMSFATLQKTAQQSWDNYLYMVERVNKPEIIVPVYHAFEDISNLDRMLNTPVLGPNKYPPYIFIGGIAGYNSATLYNKFDIIFDHIKNSKNPDVNIHALGIAKYDLLESYPFYTSDATSWLKYASYGYMKTPYGDFYCGRENNSGKVANIKFLPAPIKKNLNTYLLNSVGISVEEIEAASEPDIPLNVKYGMILKINIYYYKKMSDEYVYKPRKNLTKRLF